LSRRENIAGLLFDLGGVVIDIDFDRALHAWCEWTDLGLEEIRDRFCMDEAYKRHERGQMGTSEYFAHVRKVLELEASDSEIAVGWNAICIDEIAETVDYISSAREQLACFAFTNSNPTHQVFWTTEFPRVVESFHEIFVSSELGLRKPDREAFEAISQRTGISMGEMLFFDDTEENVVGAREAGMQAVHVETHSDVRAALEDVGVF
jgi:putative hydrolase of the HAD superfamily